MKKETQEQIVRRLLLERGRQGVSAHELTYTYGITRSAAIIHKLRKEHWMIETRTKQGEQALYIYTPWKPWPEAEPQAPTIPDDPSAKQAVMFPDSEVPVVRKVDEKHVGSH